MAVPARKTSKTKKRMRRGHIKLSVPGLAPCPNCGDFASHTWYVQIVATTMASKLLILTTNINIKKDPFLGAGPERVFLFLKFNLLRGHYFKHHHIKAGVY